MIRLITSEDMPAVVDLAVAADLFTADESWVVEKLLSDYLGGRRDDGHTCVIDEETDVLAVAYYEPAEAADRTWYLTMIAVRPDRQGQGRGATLLHQARVRDYYAAGDDMVLFRKALAG